MKLLLVYRCSPLLLDYWEVHWQKSLIGFYCDANALNVLTGFTTRLGCWAETVIYFFASTSSFFFKWFSTAFSSASGPPYQLLSSSSDDSPPSALSPYSCYKLASPAYLFFLGLRFFFFYFFSSRCHAFFIVTVPVACFHISFALFCIFR